MWGSFVMGLCCNGNLYCEGPGSYNGSTGSLLLSAWIPGHTHSPDHSSDSSTAGTLQACKLEAFDRQMYDVPYRVVKATAASHPLLVMGLRGDQGFPATPCHQLKFQHMEFLSKCASCLNLFWFVVLWLYVCPLGFGSMFLRLTTVAASHDWSWGLWGGVKVVALMAATLPPLLLMCFMCWKILNFFFFPESEFFYKTFGGDRNNEATLFKKIMHVMFGIFYVFPSACCFVECVSIFNVVNQHDIIGLEQCWEWYLYGNTISFFSILLLSVGVDGSVSRLVSAHTKFDDSTMQKIIEASDRHQSHVELVLEIFQDDLPEQLHRLRPRESCTDEGYDSLRESCEPGTEMTQRELRIGETGPRMRSPHKALDHRLR